MDSSKPLLPPAPPDTLTPGSDGGTELRKPHEMIVLVPRARRVTLTGRRIYNALLQVAQSRLAVMSSMPPADYMFEAPLPAILRTTGSSGEDRTAAKRYLREMRGLEVDWESTAPGDGVKWRGFSMLSEVAIEIRHGENWVSWSYPPTLMAALKEPTRWARIDLDILAKLGTYAALALYEICARYRDNPSGVTSRKPVQWWADALSAAPAGAERREWRKFKNERVKEAIDEINRETDLDIELIEHREGRAVVEAQFAVRKKRTPTRLPTREAAPVDANLVLRAESLGVRESKLEGLINEFGEAAVRDKVEVLERRASNSRLRGVENAYSYLRSLLRSDDSAAAGADAATAAVEPAPAGAGVARPGAVEVGASAAAGPRSMADALSGLGLGGDDGASRAAAPAAEPVSPALSAHEQQGQWLAGRIAEIKSEIAALDPLHRQPWVDQALAELAEKGLLSAVVSRRAAQGDVLHGMLGSVVVKCYAMARYGAGWDRPAG
ncbi:replication initiation protein [Aquabacterium sp. OR-4]|uniref:replication initiation protein n=1 Tax=Aquabacterium sp. OR-4 TaxID=2978127 RepID=UPI0021B2B1E4|nr:replication initiation protein [Aquabacterium sp. OR-4]MDT7838527.1 replication initiation protein [Aquabacterium sp. OR-4]